MASNDKKSFYDLTLEEAALVPRDVPWIYAEIVERAQILTMALSQCETVEINMTFFQRLDYDGFLHLLELLPFPVTFHLPYRPGMPLSLTRAAISSLPNGLYARCFGNFEVFHEGRPLKFGRQKTKELFAFLIDRKGACCTSEQIAACLWEDDTDLQAIKHKVRNLVSDLKATLTGLGITDVIVRGRDRIGLQLDKIDCDYLRHLSGTSGPQEVFLGEYMEQYSWAEGTKGVLTFSKEKL